MYSNKAIIGVLVLLSFGLLWSEDTVYLKAGDPQKGQIIGADGVNLLLEITIGTGKGKVPIPLTNIQKVEMAVPVELSSIVKSDPAAIITALEPLVKKFKGVPVDWIVDAMGTLADAYTSTGKMGESNALYAQIEQLFPGSKYLIKANVGRAKGLFAAGNLDEALKQLESLIELADKTAAPTSEEGRLYGEAFLVKGRILERKNDLEGALESYLTTITSFYQNVEVVSQAEEQAKKLRSQNPQLVVR